MDFYWAVVVDSAWSAVPGKVISYANHAESDINLRVYKNSGEYGFHYVVYDGHGHVTVSWNENGYLTEEEARSEAEKAAERHLARYRRKVLPPDHFRD